MGITATGITVVTNANVTDLASNIGFSVSGSSCAGTVVTRDGQTIAINGTDMNGKIQPCSIKSADSDNTTTHILVFTY